jgi:hypothetical protein
VGVARVWSVVESSPTSVPEDPFSSTSEFESEMSMGGSLTLVTVIVKALSKLPPLLSVARTRTE